MNKTQLFRGVTQLQLRLLGRMLLDTPEDVAPAYAAALLRLRLQHETMPDRRRAELLELAELLERFVTWRAHEHPDAGAECMCPVDREGVTVGQQCTLAGDVWLERAATHDPTKRILVRCCAAHANELLHAGDGWTHGVKP